MMTQLTSMTNRGIYFIKLYRMNTPEFVEDSRTGMTQTSVPQRSRGDCGDVGMKVGVVGGWGYGLEIARAIAANDHASRPEVLNRKTKRVKFDRTCIISSKLTYRNQDFNQ